MGYIFTAQAQLSGLEWRALGIIHTLQYFRCSFYVCLFLLKKQGKHTEKWVLGSTSHWPCPAVHKTTTTNNSNIKQNFVNFFLQYVWKLDTTQVVSLSGFQKLSMPILLVFSSTYYWYLLLLDNSLILPYSMFLFVLAFAGANSKLLHFYIYFTFPD